MEIKTAIEKFLNNSKIMKNINTWNFERKHLNTIIKYCTSNDINNCDQLNEDVIINMMLHFKSTCVNKTINKKMNLLKRVLMFNNIENDYLLNLKKLKEEKKRFDLVKEADLKNLLNYLLNIKEDNQINLSEKLIILLLLDTGIRHNELLHIKISNIDIDGNMILLETTKTKTERVVFFSKLTKELLTKYIEHDPFRNYLFWNYRVNKKYNADHVRSLFNKIKGELNLSKFTPHMLRHTFATLYVENGGKLFYLQQLLGHASLKTTEIYLHMSVKQLKEDYFKNYKYFNPIQ